MTFRILILLLISTTTMQAQKQLAHPQGEYYLQGVMETACGFLFKADSSFEFFFSQGALDRSGSGRWTITNNKVVLNSSGQAPQPFLLKDKIKRNQSFLSIEIADINASLASYIHCTAITGGKRLEGDLSSTGIIAFPITVADSLEIQFLFCPEKKTVLSIAGFQENHYRFNIAPTIMDFHFTDFTLELGDDRLTGGNPVLEGSRFHYIKSSR